MKKILSILILMTTVLTSYSQADITKRRVTLDSLNARVDEISVNSRIEFKDTTDLQDVVENSTGVINFNDSVNVSQSMDIGGNINIDSSFILGISNAAPSHQEGKVYWDSAYHCLVAYNDESDVTQQLGQEFFVRVYNNTGSTITNGRVVTVWSNGGMATTIKLAQADSIETSKVLGVATHSIEDGTYGYVTRYGLINGYNTAVFSSGQALYLSESVAGGFRTTPPAYPNEKVLVGFVSAVDATNGSFIVTPEHIKVDTVSFSHNVDTASGDFDVIGDLRVGDSLQVTNLSDLQGTIKNTAGNVTIDDVVRISGTLQQNGTIQNTTGALVLDDDVTVNEDLIVTLTTDLRGNVSNSTGTLTLNDDINVTGGIDVQGDIVNSETDIVIVNDAINISEDLTVQQNTTIYDDITHGEEATAYKTTKKPVLTSLVSTGSGDSVIVYTYAIPDDSELMMICNMVHNETVGTVADGGVSRRSVRVKRVNGVSTLEKNEELFTDGEGGFSKVYVDDSSDNVYFSFEADGAGTTSVFAELEIWVLDSNY